MEKEEAADVKAHYEYVIIGGGIAGVTCAETVTRNLEDFDVEERPMFEFQAQCPNIHVVHKSADRLDVNKKAVIAADGSEFLYEKLCLCSGGCPKLISKDNPYVLGIRDTETVKDFQRKLKGCKRVAVIGNGGIATELVYEVEGCEVLWVIKDKSITRSFIDEGAAQFFLPELAKPKDKTETAVKRMKYTINDHSVSDDGDSGKAYGSALGPDWSDKYDMTGCHRAGRRMVHVEYEVEVRNIISPSDLQARSLHPRSALPFSDHLQPSDLMPMYPTEGIRGKSLARGLGEWPVFVELTNGAVYGCDMIISATGVSPNTSVFTKDNDFSLSDDGGFLVDDHMKTSVDDVFAAGDVCRANWKHSPYWLQIRLWSQARQMGSYAAKCMVADIQGTLDTVTMDFCFELFAHVTRFFNFKVVLLGQFDAQNLGDDHELLLRVTKGEEYVKVVLKDGKMCGAILIGDTDLEETFENLILNQMDLTFIKDQLLDPSIDIEDYFD